ncbi:hypothetical protein IW261DRAFT_128676 [Armillaria novae-zelandiae]|uniref:Uncharacterized protein n=1 Tax=Armillaria novae-zelandiae TaxID=153914 RepID=A0AA39UFJ1_9AGAR|nr:hypothetical protein IW261DRAFT_128676 [Armillaria novae-zelandiae]
MPLPVPQAVFISLALEIFLYGIYSCLFVGSTYLLLFRRKKTKVIIAMTVLNIIMWLMSTGHVTLNFANTFRGFFWDNGIQDSSVLEDDANSVVLSQLTMECIEFIIGDGIVTWRAWVLWNRDRRILYTSSILILGSVATGTVLFQTLARSKKPVSIYRDGSTSVWTTSAMILTLSTNVFATTLIGYRAWVHRRLIRSLNDGPYSAAQVCGKINILALLIESGTLYCCTWCAMIFVFVFVNSGVYLMIDMLAQLSSIYPTLIITLVCLGSTLDVSIQTFHQSRPSQQVRSLTDLRNSISSPVFSTRVEMSEASVS